MPKPFFDDDEDDDYDDVTVFEPNPWGARQRVAPRKTFKAAVSRIITLVPQLVRQLPPPIPPRRIPCATPAYATPTPAIRISAPLLPTHVASVGALAFAPRMPAPIPRPHWPTKRRAVQLRKLVSALAGGVAALIIVLIVQTTRDTSTARADAPALSMTSAAAPAQSVTHQMPISPPSEAAHRFTVTPIETPTVPEAAIAVPAKPKKTTRAKRPRRILAGDTSTPLAHLRPSKR